MTEEATTEKPTNKGIKKHRSPNYPYLGLKDALTKTELLRQTGGIHPVGLNSAMSAWGLKGDGTTSSVIAALKAFGLITVSGEGKQRQMTVSEVGRKILIDHSDKSELLKKAALSPPLYGELWRKFGPELPPTDKPISEYLIFDRHFNERIVDGLIADFKATIVFANLTASDKINTQDDDVSEESDVNEEMDSGAKIRKAMEFVPKESVFKASIELSKRGVLDVVFAGSMDNVTMPMLNELFQLKEKYQALIKQTSEPDQDSKAD